MKRKRRPRHHLFQWHVASVVLAAAFPVAAIAAPKQTAQAKKAQRESKVGQRLIRKIADGGDDVMDTVLRLMEESVNRLDLDFDPGAETQSVQREIVKRLDDAILSAAKQRRRGRKRRQESGDRRSKMAKKQDSSKDKAEGKDQGQSDADSKQAGQRGNVSQVGATRGDLRETRQGWGHLPPRERDEVIQGTDDASLERYREWIERYYRALQEIDE